MKARDFLRLASERRIPLADIALALKGLGFSLDRAEIDERDMDEEKARGFLDRLGEGYPAAYLAGEVDVLGVTLFVDEHVLIPRTETEDFLAGTLFEKEDLSGRKVLDLCTGSGVIALVVKKHWKTAEVYASDIDEKALSLAERSALKNGLDVTFLRSDYLEDVPSAFDFVLSNPPYIPQGKETQAPYEPALALFTGEEGLLSYRRIFEKLEGHLKESGKAYFELEATTGKKVQELATKMLPSRKNEIIKDMEGKDRYLFIGSKN